MKSPKKHSATIYRVLTLLCISATFFLMQSFKIDKKQKQPDTTILENRTITEMVSETVNEILALEKSWAEALVEGDLNTVAGIMHRDFRLVRVYSDELPISKEMYLGMKGMSVASANVISVTITETVGPVVVARVRWSMDWAQEGVGKLPSHFDMIDTFIKSDNGTWNILSRVSQIAEEND